MSGLEIAIPVISAIFALVSAFKDGGTIVEKIKDRRARRDARPPNEQLGRALSQGAQQISGLREEYCGEFGEAFGRDAATASRLKDVTIALQDSIIRQLTVAFNDDSLDDFAPVITTVIQAKIEAVNILNNHYLTLRKRELTRGPPTAPEVHPPSRIETITSQATFSESDGGGVVAVIPRSPESSPLAASKGGKGLRLPWRRRTSAEVVQRTPPCSISSLSASPNDLGMTGHHRTSSQPTRPDSMTPRSPLTPHRFSGTPSPNTQDMLRDSFLLVSPTPPSSTHEWTSIGQENQFAGFCKGAWHAQQLRLTKAMEPSMRDYQWLYHCRKCKFRLHGDGARRGDPHFDDRIQVSGSVYFRILFLYKSHVPVKDAARRYQCLLCVLDGGQSAIYTHEDHLFEHIARHGGTLLGQTAIVGPIEAGSDRVSAATMNTFDFYIPQQTQRRRSSVAFRLPDSAMAVAERERTSTLFDGDVFENVWEEDESTRSGHVSRMS